MPDKLPYLLLVTLFRTRTVTRTSRSISNANANSLLDLYCSTLQSTDLPHTPSVMWYQGDMHAVCLDISMSCFRLNTYLPMLQSFKSSPTVAFTTNRSNGRVGGGGPKSQQFRPEQCGRVVLWLA
ncbi:hypothetical protein F4777DRAFT_331641 [Nemania sp. FL0916]|nr:hypothetical protein F4777DRAFT_331641 [Nemania sp. FL0916]